MSTTTIEPVGNRDHCGRCGVRHGGNDHLCPVHGTVSNHCCTPACNPAEWSYNRDALVWLIVKGGHRG